MDKIYLFTQVGCINCPAVKLALEEKKIDFIEIDINSKKFDSIQFELLDNNIFIMTTPRIVIQENNKLRMVELEEL